MRHPALLALLALSAPALAQDMGPYNRALSQFNAGAFDDAARGFYELAESASDPDIRARSEYYLAQSLARKSLPFSALIYYTGIVRAGNKHPFY
ncbi:MAG TPA: tetratricopeptide repeat protein, partial [Myxococcaceae bacterium]|nr:tetratricopeptide repeat protein [Myxococcaceae bacterium]